MRQVCARILCSVDITLSVEDEVVRKAPRRAEQLGTTLNQLMREYLEQVAGRLDPARDASEFKQLSRQSRGASKGWTVNREEVYERR